MTEMDATFWDARYEAAGEGSVWGGDANRYVTEVVTPLPPGTALDFGCGEGRNALWLASLGWRSAAADFSQAGLDTGKRWAAHRGLDVTWIRADLTSPDAPAFGPNFSLVVWCYLHLAEGGRARAMDLAADAVAPGGMLLWIGHDLSNISNGVGGPQDLELLCTPDQVRDELVSRGLTNISRCEVARRPVPTDGPDGRGAVRYALDTLVVAERPS